MNLVKQEIIKKSKTKGMFPYVAMTSALSCLKKAREFAWSSFSGGNGLFSLCSSDVFVRKKNKFCLVLGK